MNGPVTPPALLATADELDALAYGLAGAGFPGAGFPGLGPTLVAAAAPEQRAAVARRLTGGLRMRGIVQSCAGGWQVAPAYRELLDATLDPDLVVGVRVRTPAASTMTLVSRGRGAVVLHEATTDGDHRLRHSPTDLLTTVRDLLAAPAHPPHGAGAERLTRTELRRRVEHGPAAPFTHAVAGCRYAARVTPFGGAADGTYHAASAVLLAAESGPLWTVEVHDDTVAAEPVDDVTAWLRQLLLEPVPARANRG
ncbi:hypothetical protein GCM10009827_088350 [Dactylosporangium maewongense]|uniref:ESX secretion-associated protein EspG n=1 Tax=Dactylosporangium maewongense TaxID=634393 RepID=A0ABN2C7Y6_9ACTN